MESPIALLVMSHGDFAKAAIDSAELIVGKQSNYATMGVVMTDELDSLKQEMREKVQQLDRKKGLLILTDIVGGTPTNLASEFLMEEETLLVSGINLPVLLEILMNRANSLDTLKSLVKTAYKQGLSIRTKRDLEGEVDDDDLL
ncbi:PTS sugar transporter subunit IIA [Listeria kieliensis]|uniref:PTS beta-glucoside transporter subunit IIA n=1 Tax=Listeria kieliensis TaxID=1621700 RepID=A0A3D8TT86_9LIST|nr:PTS sugar transporter subunit IIA [Listeria kieliensis]RDX01026.1 PTS beta-glucoside transporter subunit IIA [Listeria kieliensis]